MSQIIVDTIKDSNGNERYACRAWVNFNGTGTVAIRASGNVSSVTDNGTGDYTVNFTIAMPDTNYSVSGLANGDSIAWTSSLGLFTGTSGVIYAPSTSSFRFTITRDGGAIIDREYASVAVFR